MEEASNNLEFEQALEYRDTINSINEIVEKQTMELMMVYQKISLVIILKMD